MTDNNIEVYLTMQEDVTAKMPAVTNSLVANKSAIRELAMGTSYLGSAFLGMSIAMSKSNNATFQSVANIMSMVGGIMVAVGSAARFVSAIAKMTSALQKFNITQAIASAFAGPMGWIKLLLGAAAAGAAVYGITRLAGGGGGGERTTGTTTINQHIYGNLVTQRQAVDKIQEGLVLKSGQNYSAGLK